MLPTSQISEHAPTARVAPRAPRPSSSTRGPKCRRAPYNELPWVRS
jgi:hypothetical protein